MGVFGRKNIVDINKNLAEMSIVVDIHFRKTKGVLAKVGNEIALNNINIEEMILLLDNELVTKLFSILIENALDALPEGGKILIHSETNGIQGKIHLSDTGSGISAKDIPHIFNPFFSTKADGAGIDLATAKRIMSAHGGLIQVTSKQDEGTSFLLSFPMERRHPLRTFRLEE